MNAGRLLVYEARLKNMVSLYLSYVEVKMLNNTCSIHAIKLGANLRLILSSRGLSHVDQLVDLLLSSSN